MPRMLSRLAAVILLCVAAVQTSGCSDSAAKTNPIARLNDSNIKRVANLYAACQSTRSGHGPDSIDQIKEFAQGMPADSLKMMGVDSRRLDDLFISERDGLPFKIKFGAVRYVQGPHIPVIFEQQGHGSLRQVAYTNARVDDVDELHYQQLWDEKQESPTLMPVANLPAPGQSSADDAASATSR